MRWACRAATVSPPPTMASSGITVLVLGAGQDVGKSCVLVTLGGFTVMFDCGMHMGYADERQFPAFDRIPPGTHIDCIVLTHFHLDHCGALAYFTESPHLGFDGPIYMTSPTRAICPIMLEDYRKILERKALAAAAAGGGGGG